MDEMIKVFVINLEYQKERREKISKQLFDRNIEFEIFPAVVGKNLSEEYILKYYDRNFYENRHHSYPVGMIGCALSHFFIYEKMVKEGITEAIILEDDVILLPDFNRDFISNLSAQSVQDEITLLFYHKFTPMEIFNKDSKKINEKYTSYHLADLQGLVSTGGYFLTNKVAKNMYENILPLRTYPDEWVTFGKKNFFSKLNIIYPFIIESALLESSISYVSSNNPWINLLINYCKSKNILWFNQLSYIRRKYLFNKMRKVKLNE
jgi:glycosyl transferase, family 25